MKPASPSTPPDAELARAARRGDKRAFVEIVARHQAMVCGVAFAILHDFAASEDAAQEAFLTAWRKMDQLREPEHLRAWLGQIARTAALSHLRKKHPGADPDDFPEIIDTAPSPDEAAASDEEAALVREALTKLPETYRLPLVLFYREGQSVRSVAETLELSEDAVKQRLARGRDMLRERMMGVVETVLTRTRPTAVFTMVIAAAIGALAAPAAVAGAAFTASAATAASSSGSVVTVMSTSKSSLTIAALIAAVCLPLGYGARVGIETGPPAKARPQAAAAPAEIMPVKNRELSGALHTEWLKLHEDHGSSPDAMPLLYKAISAIQDPVRRRVFRAAQIAEWVETDPAGGLAFFMEKGRDGGQRSQFFNEWLQRDASAAVSALLAAGPGWVDIARGSLQEIAKRAPDRILEIATKLPAPDGHWDTSVRDAMAIVAEGSLESARAAAEAMTGVNREQALAGIAKAWARKDLDAAIAWAKALPDGVNKDEIIRGALIGAAGMNPQEALAKVKSIPPGGRDGYFADSTGARVLKEAAKQNYDATVTWLKDHPADTGREDLMGMANAVTDRINADVAAFLNHHLTDGSLEVLMPAIASAMLNDAGGQCPAIWDWLKAQPETDTIKKLRQEIINSAGYRDPTFALKLVADFPKTAEGDTFVQQVASSLLNNGSMLSRFDSLMEQAPERLRQPLLMAAFNSLGGENVVNPQKWLERVTQAPEEQRVALSARVAAAWTGQVPEDAAAWVVALPAGETRAAALTSVANVWSNKDPYGASEWITSLPAGSEKDSAASSLVRAIAKDSPADAWQWALAITDPATRDSNLILTLEAVQKHDPAAARQWMEASPLPSETKDRLRATLDAAGK